ncbi:MAG: hypothetical protein WAK66_06105, partial [Methylocystis sp.]
VLAKSVIPLKSRVGFARARHDGRMRRGRTRAGASAERQAQSANRRRDDCRFDSHQVWTSLGTTARDGRIFPEKSALSVGAPSREEANLAKDGYGEVNRFDDMAKNAASIQLNVLARRAAKTSATGSLRSQIPRQIVPML